jgi:hypothetical protein
MNRNPSFRRRGGHKSQLGFTPGQQGLFRPLVDAAWAKHFAAHPGCLWKTSGNEEAAKRIWYESALKNATGKTSTTECDPKRDFEDAMVYFEQLIGESIYWATRKYGADARRIAWNIREIVRANDVEEYYMRGVARRMLRLDDDAPLPLLEEMDYRDLLIIMGELKRFLRRGGRPGASHRKDPF